ncbi:MBL fold metallo-hydrolase [Variovorax sp. dw_954]|uniref:MBL fold metallo-hydrolase n=1 Tax=Variovorax sp. dw_954 TaxID=2720078 RepID=UPI0031F61ABB
MYGPVGTVGLVRSAIDYGRANATIRRVDEGRKQLPQTLWKGHDVRPGAVYQDANVRVTCVENTHFEVPDEQSLSYRFDTASRSVVFSGDTGYSENVIALAKGADVLVHEAMHLEATRAILRGMFQQQGRPPAEVESLITHVLTKHTSTEDVGRVAAAAGVKLLVLNHLIPGGLEKQPLSDDDYIAGVRKFYSGPVIVGRDLQAI